MTVENIGCFFGNVTISARASRQSWSPHGRMAREEPARTGGGASGVGLPAGRLGALGNGTNDLEFPNQLKANVADGGVDDPGGLAAAVGGHRRI
ncbi:MAG: hypothetical protein O3A92_03850 [Verrucomicrobia bacterium]|nr:hypothetical protein [Verrucomicrobiota bacterium]